MRVRGPHGQASIKNANPTPSVCSLLLSTSAAQSPGGPTPHSATAALSKPCHASGPLHRPPVPATSPPHLVCLANSSSWAFNTYVSRSGFDLLLRTALSLLALGPAAPAHTAINGHLVPSPVSPSTPCSQWWVLRSRRHPRGGAGCVCLGSEGKAWLGREFGGE